MGSQPFANHTAGAMRASWWSSAVLLAAVITVSAADWSCVTHQSDSVQAAWQSCPLQDEDTAAAGGSGARVRDSHQLSSSNGLGEEHNTEPKTNAAAASNGKIVFYQRQLRLEQQKCPNSALKCPSSASAAKKPSQWKQSGAPSITSPDAPTLEPNRRTLIHKLNNFTFDQMYRLWFQGQTYIHPWVQVKSFLSAANTAEGQCVIATVPSQKCHNCPWNPGQCGWSHQAYKLACATDTLYTSKNFWSSHERQLSTIHGQMGKFCSTGPPLPRARADGSLADGSPPSACEGMLCLRSDRVSIRRGTGASSIKARPTINQKMGDFYFSVECGRRQKLMYCPMKKGKIYVCSVRKKCGGPRAIEPADKHGGGAFHADGEQPISGKALKANKNLWRSILKMPEVKQAAARACAAQCGFY